MVKKLVASIAVGILFPAIGLAVTPTAYLERSEVIATGKQVRAYRVPTRDIVGKIRYYDLVINLSVLDDGKIATSASSITPTLSPSVLSNQFVPGTYTDNQGTTCIVNTSVLNGGRVEVALSCKESSYIFTANWASGAIGGHPLELDLVQTGIDKIPGYGNYSWGKVGATSNVSWWDCFYSGGGDIISARQVGNTLSVYNYRTDNMVNCGINLIKQ